MSALIYFGNPGSGSGSGCACGPQTPQLRVIGGTLSGGGPTNMLAWIAAYDITTIAWGDYISGNFTSPSQTSPPSTSGGSVTGSFFGSQNYLRATNAEQGPPDCTISASSAPFAYRAQALLPTPTAYYVIAWGGSIDAAYNGICGEPAYWVAQGCTYAQQADDQYPMIVDLPIPDDTLDSTILVQNYYIGLITPSAGYSNMLGASFAVQQDLNWGTPGTVCGGENPAVICADVGMDGLGLNWNSAAACYATVSPSDEDPFTGIDDAP